jgi:hypothetical protein
MTQDVSGEDYAAVANHMARYCHYIDGGEAGKWAACFAENGAFDGPVSPEPIVGHAALAEFARQTYERSDGGKMRHLVGNLACDYGASRDAISAKLYNYVTTWDGTGRPSALMALCEVTLARSGGGWLIQRNKFTMLF